MQKVSIVLFASIVALLPVQAEAGRGQARHVTQGDLGLYTVYIEGDQVQQQDAREEPPARSTRDPRNDNDFYGWQQPKVRKLVKRFEAELGIKAVSMTSYTLPTFTAYMHAATAESLLKDPRVQRVVPVFGGEDDFSGWTNYFAGSEMVPWGKQAIGADDTQDFTASQNIVYMIDGVAMIDGTQQIHSDVNLTVSTAVNAHYIPVGNRAIMAPGHANHVAGILGARIFTFGVRGVAPGIRIINVIKGDTDAEVIAALNWTLADAQQRGIYAVANISSNSARWAPGGAVYPHVAALRSRVLVVQSAGNYRVNACTVAYGPANPGDGVLVVAGIDENEQQALAFNNAPSGYLSEPGSNWGECVEAWAPAPRIVSNWNTGFTSTMELSGTSMAAPHVAAMAARFGTTATTPAQREAYVRSRLYVTGFFDEVGAPIRLPSIVNRTQNARLTNISGRALVLTGNDVMIGGFVIAGPSNKTVVITAAGPSLGAFGIPNPLANPTITLVRASDGAVVAANDDWGSAPNAAQISASGFAPSNGLESAIMLNLSPGGYTTIVSGVGGGTGAALLATHEADAPTSPLINLSTRAMVQTGSDVLIGGFIITGTASQTVVVRAIGPSLIPLGIPNALANPTMYIVRASDGALMGSNDNWQSAGNAWMLMPSGFAPSHPNESAILITLAPGAYSAVVSGVGGGTGVGMVEVHRY